VAYLDSRDEVPRPTAVRNRLAILFVTAAVVYAIDVVTKIIAVAQLEDRRPIEILGTFFQLDFTRNPGAAFSLGVGMTVVFSCITIGVIIAILRTAKRLGSIAWALVFGLVLGGALGNLTDRVFRDPGFLRGHVIDFLHLTHWPIFNVADMAFTFAGVLVVVLILRNVPLEGHPPPEPDGDADPA
jgi:signal peptidase II